MPMPATLPQYRALAPHEIDPILMFDGPGPISRALLMYERSRACRRIARQIIEARRDSGITIQQMAQRIGMDWRVIRNIEATGMLLLSKREIKGLWDLVDLATAIGRRIEMRYEAMSDLARKARLERKLGHRPYEFEWGADGRRALYAGMLPERARRRPANDASGDSLAGAAA